MTKKEGKGKRRNDKRKKDEGKKKKRNASKMDGERATDGGGWRGSGLIGPAASKKLEQEQ